MPSIFQITKDPIGRLAFGGLKRASSLAYKGITAGPIGRSVTGAGIGAATGYFGTDYQSPTSTVGAMIQGATLGAMAGFGTAMIPKAIKANQVAGGYLSGFGKNASGLQKFSASPLAVAGRQTAKAGWWGTKQAAKMGRFAFEHPLLVGGAVAGGIGVSSMSSVGGQSFTSPTMEGARVNIQYNQQAAAASELQAVGMNPIGSVGSAPQMLGRMHQTMQQSTQGLVQGLSRGRHG